METIVAFHKGRGGRFNNPGHVKFIGKHIITEFTNDLFLSYENQGTIFKAINGKTNLLDLYYNATDDYKENEFKDKFENRTGLKFGELIWVDCNGNSVGLSYQESKTGIGYIDIDGEYDTTCCVYLKHCTEREIDLIQQSDYWYKDLLIKEYNDFYGI